jgi:hypothetical protein
MISVGMAVARLRGRIGCHDENAQRGQRDDSGAVLILALIFLVAVSLIVTALLTWVGTSLSATAAFTNQRNLESATTSTVDLAIQQTKTTFNSALLEASPPQPCWGTGSTSQLTINGYTIDVWCSMTWSPFSGATRTITYSACPDGSGSQSTLPNSAVTATQCAASPLLQAIETFDDYAPNSPVSNEPVPCSAVNTCGQTQNQVSWLWEPVVPAVTSVTGASGPANGQTTFTINGTGFVAGTVSGQFASTVNLVWETGPNAESWTHPPTANQPETDENGVGTIVQATVTSVSADGTQIQAVAPTVSTGPYYFVTVTTPGGTSPYLVPGSTTQYNTFVYSVPAPTVTSVTGSASVTGGALVTITGTGFFDSSNFPTQVLFSQNGGTPVLASDVTVSSTGTSLTALSPAVSSPGTWAVQVETSGGTSSGSTTLNLGVQAPLITSINPTTSNASAAQITISGANFVSGATVWFCLTSAPATTLTNCENGSAGNGEIAASASVASTGNQIAVSVPTTSMTRGSSYYPQVQIQVTNSNGTTSTLVSQPYVGTGDTFTFTN